MGELAGERVLITGGARGIGALIARRLHERGARVALLGLEPDLLGETAAACGDAPWFECDVANRDAVNKLPSLALSPMTSATAAD